jgi:hypothetical protein
METMKYKIAAHPTMYGGVQFRSRLEARWAAFFDLLDWSWEYEPLDLKGWVPDFRLGPLPPLRSHPKEYYGVKMCRDSRPFVEIKPVDLEARGDVTPGLSEAFSTEKIRRAYDGTVLLLGVSPEYAWRIPDSGDGVDCACPLRINSRLWREAGNKTQWRPR